MNKIKLAMHLAIALMVAAGTTFAQEKRSYKPIDESVSTNEVINSKIGILKFPLGCPKFFEIDL